MTESDCLSYYYKHGWDWNENGVELYNVLERVSCWYCQIKKFARTEEYLYVSA